VEPKSSIYTKTKTNWYVVYDPAALLCKVWFIADRKFKIAATAGHVDVVEILLDHGADMEAQSERTKDTPLSLACSGGRFEVIYRCL